MKRLRSFLPILILIAIGIALLFSGVLDRFRPEHLATEQVALQARIAAHPILAGLLHVGVLTLFIATGVPGGAMILIFAGGMLFGIVVGTILSSIGLTLGATILFFASKHAFGDHSHAHAPGLVGRLRTGYQAHPVSYTFFLRLVPFFPFGGVTVGLAWFRCPLWLFVTATGLGGAVMTGIETALGAGLAKNVGQNQRVSLDQLVHDPAVIVPVLGLGLLALVPILIGKLRRKPAVPPAAPSAEDEPPAP